MTPDYDRISDDWYPAFFHSADEFHLLRSIDLSPMSWSDWRRLGAYRRLDFMAIRRETGDLV